MILNPSPVLLPYTEHLASVSPLFRREFPKVPTDTPRSKLIHLQGYYQGFNVSKKGRLKSLRLQVDQDLLTLKIPKLLSHGICHRLLFGQALRVIAKQGKKNLKAMFLLPVETLENSVFEAQVSTVEQKYPKISDLYPAKAQIDTIAFQSVVPAAFAETSTLAPPLTIVPFPHPSPAAPPVLTPVPPARPTTPRLSKPVQIQVCGKGNCKKRGSCQLAQELRQQVQESGLKSQIEVQITGCLNHCKQAPNLQLKPQGQLFSQVQSQDLPQILRALGER